MYLIEGANFEFIIDTSQLFFFPQMYIFTQTAHPTMNSIALNDVYQSINVVSLENFYLSCNDVCGWSSVLNGIKTQGTSTTTTIFHKFTSKII